MEQLRQRERRRQGRPPEPSAGSVDSQSIKTATQGTAVGFDGNKKVKGRKRHLLVDPLGLILAVVVTSAGADDRVGLMAVVESYWATGVKRLRKLWVDGPYRGTLVTWVAEHLWFILQPVLCCDDRKGFVVVPRRWVVERTFAWLTQCRRLSKDDERLSASSEAMISIAMTRLMLRRLATASS